MFIRLFKEQLKPKFHFLVHYPGIIRKMGLLNNLSSVRYEGFHKLSKTYASIVTSRKNIVVTLATKLQLHFCYRLLIKKGLDDLFECGAQKEITSIEFTNTFHADNGCLTEVSWIRFNSILFKPDFIIITNLDENNLSFGIMTRTLIDRNKNIFVYYKKCVTLGLDTHFKAYEISLPHVDDPIELRLVNTSKPLDVKTCNYHILGDGSNFVSVFDI